MKRWLRKLPVTTGLRKLQRLRRLRNFRIRRARLHGISDRALLVNLYVTQAVVLAAAVMVLRFQERSLFHLLVLPENAEWMAWGGGMAGLALGADWLVTKWAPEGAMDDGGVNERLFASRPVWHIALISLTAAVGEELLFRGAIQHFLGVFWSSALFAAVHVRYLHRWLMTGLVFGVSVGLGWIYELTGTLWAPILAHFLIDFISGCIIRFRGES